MDKILFSLFLITISLVSFVQKEIKIGKQVWMISNLNVEKFQNGDVIPEAKTFGAWQEAGSNKKPVWCYYGNDPKNGEKYGKLYNWYAVNDPRGLAPKGWHVATDKEWTELVAFLGNNEAAADKLKAKSGWEEEGNGNNSSGFSAMPGGLRDYSGEFNYALKGGYWWTATEETQFNAWDYMLLYRYGNVNRYSNDKSSGYSVRCVKN